MNKLVARAALLTALLVVGCAGPTETVVLLPNPGGQDTAVTVTRDGRQAVLAQRNGRRFDARDAARADQHVDLEPALRHRHDMQIAYRPPHECTHGRHGAAGVVGRQGDARAIGDAIGKSLQA